MVYYQQSKNEPSELGMSFCEGEEVSFIYKHEIRTGIIQKLLVNSAIVHLVKHSNIVDNTSQTVINYSKLMAVFSE